MSPILVALVLAACYPAESGPTSPDELVHFFLAQAYEQDHPAILDGAASLQAWYEAGGFGPGDPASGLLSDLTPDELATLPELRWTPDPAPCAGVYVVTELSCTLDDAAAIALVEDQTEIFPDNYASYARTWDSDPACYLSGTCDAVDWTSVIEDSLVADLASMTYEVVVRLRRSRDEDGVPGAMLVRSILPEPATDDLDAGSFDQAYHIEVYAPYGAGTLHLYGMWSYAEFFGSDPDSEYWFDQYLDALWDAESQLEKVCVEGW